MYAKAALDAWHAKSAGAHEQHDKDRCHHDGCDCAVRHTLAAVGGGDVEVWVKALDAARFACESLDEASKYDAVRVVVHAHRAADLEVPAHVACFTGQRRSTGAHQNCVSLVINYKAVTDILP